MASLKREKQAVKTELSLMKPQTLTRSFFPRAVFISVAIIKSGTIKC